MKNSKGGIIWNSQYDLRTFERIPLDDVTLSDILKKNFRERRNLYLYCARIASACS